MFKTGLNIFKRGRLSRQAYLLKRNKYSIQVSSSPSGSELNQSNESQHAFYLDVQATAPIDPRVLDAMMPYQLGSYGNMHSRTHAFGWEAEESVEKARKQIADLIGANPKEIVFTSGATESNNIALKGVAQFYGHKKNHIITLQTEHKCVLDSCRKLEQDGYEITYLPVKENGIVDLKQLEEAIKPNTALVSIMAVNNEIGVIQPLKEIGELCRAKKTFFHSDCAQALGKLPLNMDALNIDLASLSGHKIYGPKGIGALYVRRKPRVRVMPQMSGGGQERGMRSGTMPVHLAVGFGAACQVASEEMENDSKWIQYLFHRLYDRISKNIPEIQINGDLQQRYLGNMNISFRCVEGESLLMALKDVAISSGSACTSASLEPSYVLRALGVAEDMAHTSLRIGISRYTTEEEIDFFADKLERNVAKLREMSPLWDMFLEGIDVNSIQWTQEH